MRILLPYLKKYYLNAIGATISILIVALSSVWQPRLLQSVLDAILNNQTDKVKIYGVYLILLAILGIVAGITNVYFASKLAQGVTSDLRERTYAKIQSFSFGNIEKFSAGSLVVRLINDMNQVTNLVMTCFMQLLRIPVIFIGAFSMAYLTLPRLWWIEVLMVILIALVAGITANKMGKLFDKFQAFMDKLNTLVKENLQGVRVVKSFNQQLQAQNKFSGVSDDLNSLNLVIGYLFSLTFPAFMLATYFAVSLAVLIIGKTIGQYPNDVAAISSYVTYLQQLMYSILIGAMTLMQFTRGFVSLGRIKEVLETKPELTFVKNPPEQKLDGSVSFEKVNFSYPDATKPTLSDISFTVKSGEMIGIVGATGSGKSTLAQLLARLYDPSSGVIKIGGLDLKQIDEATLRKQVSFVLQKAILFSGTIKSNLQQGKKDATQLELDRATQIAQAAEFIQRYPDEYEHEVNERSANFSGGQKQRLSIARGVIGQPKILILDDSTSALDAKSEKLVQEALDKELKQTTTFIIAEKIISVMHADKILVLDEGRLVASGTHQELLVSSPVYQEIYQTQKAKEKLASFA